MAEARLLLVPVAGAGPVTDRMRVREIDDDEGRRLVRVVRRGGGSVVTWRRAQMVPLSALGMDAATIAKVETMLDSLPSTCAPAGYQARRSAGPPVCTGRGR